MPWGVDIEPAAYGDRVLLGGLTGLGCALSHRLIRAFGIRQAFCWPDKNNGRLVLEAGSARPLRQSYSYSLTNMLS